MTLSPGFIAIDGHDLKIGDPGVFARTRMGVVLQENSLFDSSVRENIRLGRPDASEEAITAVAKAAGLHEFITSRTLGYGALAGEHGVRFSIAQLQRLALARAILRDPKSCCSMKRLPRSTPLRKPRSTKRCGFWPGDAPSFPRRTGFPRRPTPTTSSCLMRAGLWSREVTSNCWPQMAYMRTSGASRPGLTVSARTAGMWMSMCSA